MSKVLQLPFLRIKITCFWIIQKLIMLKNNDIYGSEKWNEYFVSLKSSLEQFSTKIIYTFFISRGEGQYKAIGLVYWLPVQRSHKEIK